MDCNNTLTDAKLEVVFAVTDEEIRQIEQPMECLIERTQHKYKNPIPLQRSYTLYASRTTVNLHQKGETALIFRKTFDNNSKRDALQRLEDVFYTMKSVIEE